MNDIFSHKTRQHRAMQMPSEWIQLNDVYFEKWLGALFIGFYIAYAAPGVISGAHSLGTFLTTIAAFEQLCETFGEGYEEFMQVCNWIVPLQFVTTLLSKSTDGMVWQHINRQRRVQTQRAREEILRGKRPNPDQVQYLSDSIPLQLSDLSYCPNPEENRVLLQCKHLAAPQGALVGIIGAHGQGHTTLMRLLGHELFPTEGQIFVPSHLRVLFVTREIYMLNGPAWSNLVFGCTPEDIDPFRIRRIFELLRLPTALIAEELGQCEGG
jgi:ABC-type uncharacterized transport system fused permease/ATPase subunit